MDSGDAFGPWAHDLAPAERLARLRATRAIVTLLAPFSGALIEALQAAEVDETHLPIALMHFDRMPTLPKRRVLSTMGSLVGRGRGRSPR